MIKSQCYSPTKKPAFLLKRGLFGGIHRDSRAKLLPQRPLK